MSVPNSFHGGTLNSERSNLDGRGERTVVLSLPERWNLDRSIFLFTREFGTRNDFEAARSPICGLAAVHGLFGQVAHHHSGQRQQIGNLVRARNPFQCKGFAAGSNRPLTEAPNTAEIGEFIENRALAVSIQGIQAWA